jgi:hypothetical protein
VRPVTSQDELGSLESVISFHFYVCMKIITAFSGDLNAKMGE